jgi:hypothetical protein
VKIEGVEYRGDETGQQPVLKMKKSRKNYKKGAITRAEEKAMEPFLEGKDGCACDLVAGKENSRFHYTIYFLILFQA